MPTLTARPVDAQKIIGRISAMAMVDDEFRTRLNNDPEFVLAEHGLEMPAGITVTIVPTFDDVPPEHDPMAMYLVVPDADTLTHEDLTLHTVTAKSTQSTASSCCTTPGCLTSASSASTQCG